MNLTGKLACQEARHQVKDLCDKVNMLMEEGAAKHDVNVSQLQLILERHRMDMNLQTAELL